MLIISTSRKDHSLAARERAAGEMVFVEHDDSAAMRRLREEAAKYDDADGSRLSCYLILQDQTSLWLLQTVGLSKEIEEKAGSLEGLGQVKNLGKNVNDVLGKSVNKVKVGINWDEIIDNEGLENAVTKMIE